VFQHTLQKGKAIHLRCGFSGFHYVICFTAQGGAFDDERFRKDLSEECYLPPLKLVDGGEGTFLETRFEITADNRIRHWLKNDNLADQPAKVTRYAHYDLLR
jgi:hypothetical protein